VRVFAKECVTEQKSPIVKEKEPYSIRKGALL